MAVEKSLPDNNYTCLVDAPGEYVVIDEDTAGPLAIRNDSLTANDLHPPPRRKLHRSGHAGR